MEDFIHCLLSLSIGGSILTCLILLLRGSIRNRLPKSFYYYAWLLVLLRLALPIPGRLDLPEGKPEFIAPIQWEQPENLPVFSEWEENTSPLPEAPPVRPPAAPLKASPVSTPAAPEPDGAVMPEFQIADVIVLTWALGFLACLSRDLIGYFRFRHAIRRTLIQPRASDLAIYDRLTGARRPRLYRSDAVDTPMLMGILHPTLLLPDRRYSPEILECVFRHELIHYQRRDILYKWFTVPVLALHWFNPLTIFIRRDIDRCCELSCDERLLKEMDHDQRKSYGETLLVLAARSTPTRTVLSTTFATEKKNLKERLVHIMNFNQKSKWAILAAALLLIAVGVCAIVFGPQGEAAPAVELPVTTAAPELVTEPQADPVAATEPPETTIAAGATAVVVKNVDELLAAIGSDTEITLEPGVYDLTQAKDYGDAKTSNTAYRWDDTGVDGFQLTIKNVSNLTITGAEKEGCEIVTAPRYAAVLGFENCDNVKLSTVTAGHTAGPGHCVGAVVYLTASQNVTVDNAVLYGCGTYGVQAHSCDNIDVVSCDIKECSLGAAWFRECRNVQIRQSKVFDCGLDGAAYELFYFNQSRNCAVVDCDITGSNASTLFQAISCKDVYYVSNKLSGCKLGTLFDYSGAAPIVDGSSFQGVGDARMITAMPTLSGTENDRVEGAVPDLEGKELKGPQLKSMTHRDTGFTLPAYEAVPAPSDATPGKDIPTNVEVVEASTVDEFLAAIRPNTVVKLAEGTYDLSTASDYGSGWNDYYRWTEVFDGYELEIMNVANFHIQGAGQNKTILTAIPRYAEVLLFTGSTELSVSGITAGHTIEPGSCTGGVLTFENCSVAAISDSGLYGCGIYGITALECRDFNVTNTEIYDCSYGAVNLQDSENMAFDNCNIHDCPMPYFGSLWGCQNITVDGLTITGS